MDSRTIRWIVTTVDLYSIGAVLLLALGLNSIPILIGLAAALLSLISSAVLKLAEIADHLKLAYELRRVANAPSGERR